MAYATGTRALAALFLFLSFIPPWIQLVVTLPLGIYFWKQARGKEKERERELNNVD